MNTGLRITVFAAALAATFGATYGVGNAVGPISPEAKGSAHGGAHAHGHESGGHEQHEAALPGGLEVSQGGYTLDLKTPHIEPGKAGELRFAIVQDATGRAATGFEREHGKELLLIVASRDLTVYRHLHPTQAADGTWSTPVELPKAGAYRVFADFKPKGGEGLTLGADLAAPGTYQPASLPTHNTTAQVDGYEVKLGGALAAGTGGDLKLTVTRNGTPVRDLEPYLGAYGHLVALRAGDLAYLHVYPNGEPGDGETKPGPEVSFMATAPSTGMYRLFLVFKHEGKVHTAAFTVHASGAEGGRQQTSSSEGEHHQGH
ncbi:hypothetical protein [Streptomyces colonosanans]|uniref:Heavy metal-binding domain-containing protein n=1 Tax=Streptomyces colonosanans TaxID=1428652 RepID=A0A1S2Q5F5_9ACTN|nr:hypothetical protein [Streptomyces colonosanans]OIK01348.1 hypothetical protein BIV24_00920 [Streptomyces colonosanans]